MVEKNTTSPKSKEITQDRKEEKSSFDTSTHRLEKALLKKSSELEKEISEGTEFSVQSLELTEAITPTLSSIKASQDTQDSQEVSSLEEQIAEERPLETSNRRTGVDYRNVFNTTDYLNAAGERKRSNRETHFAEHFDSPQTHVVNPRDFIVHDPRLEHKDDFHRQVEVDIMKYDHKRFPFEEDDKKYYG